VVLEAVAGAQLGEHLIGEGLGVVVDGGLGAELRPVEGREFLAPAVGGVGGPALPAIERSSSLNRAARPRASVRMSAAAWGERSKYSSMCRANRAAMRASSVSAARAPHGARAARAAAAARSWRRSGISGLRYAEREV
jgi:hypothetical protein